MLMVEEGLDREMCPIKMQTRFPFDRAAWGWLVTGSPSLHFVSVSKNMLSHTFASFSEKAFLKCWSVQHKNDILSISNILESI